MLGTNEIVDESDETELIQERSYNLQCDGLVRHSRV